MTLDQQTHVCSTLFCKQALHILRRNTPAKPMTASADTLKSCGFFLLPSPGGARHEAIHQTCHPVADQLTLLKARGLHIRDEARAARFLEAVSFFRLTPYMRPFQLANSPNHDFLPDTGFRQLSQLYDFDRRLRLLVIDAIERVEVAARATISNHMGSAHGAHWYLQRNLFKNHYDHARLL